MRPDRKPKVASWGSLKQTLVARFLSFLCPRFYSDYSPVLALTNAGWINRTQEGKMHTLKRFGREFSEGGRCPACSGSRDTGGRLELKRRKNFFLKCKKCRYTLHSEKTIMRNIQRASAYHDKQIGMNTKTHL